MLEANPLANVLNSGLSGVFMKSPQKENGYTPIANELLDALCRLHLSGNEWSYVHALIRKTYGYHKKEDWITGSQIVLMTGLKKERVSEAKKRLIERKIVTENRNKISLNKDYDGWLELRKSVTIVTENRNKRLRKTVNTKERKIILQKITSDSVESQSKKLLVMTNKFNPLGAEILKEMETVDPKNKTYYANTTQRKACDFLLDEYGLEEVKKRIMVLPKTNKMPYFPTITTPVQLKDKWVQLQDAVERKRGELKEKNKVAFV